MYCVLVMLIKSWEHLKLGANIMEVMHRIRKMNYIPLFQILNLCLENQIKMLIKLNFDIMSPFPTFTIPIFFVYFHPSTQRMLLTFLSSSQFTHILSSILLFFLNFSLSPLLSLISSHLTSFYNKSRTSSFKYALLLTIRSNNQMNVRDTFLSSVDRLSVKSILTGKTGTCLGVLASAAFIAVAFLIFLGPVIMYFRGDYTQGIFEAFKSQSILLYTGCDFKIAISFYQKSSGKLINHTSIKQLINMRILYSAPDKTNYYADSLPCKPSYFAQMTDKPHEFNAEDCFIAPDGLGYLSKLQQGYLSVFGFKFEPVCNNPFMCSTFEATRNNITMKRTQFFTNHYFVLRFTTKQLDERGNYKTRFNEMYSTQWDAEQSYMPTMWVNLQIQRVFLDDSIMPWINNQTRDNLQYFGVTNGQSRGYTYMQSVGSFALLSVLTRKTFNFRQYKKLDWIIGMLGGGILALFLIFWLPCHFLSFMKKKLQNCASTVLVQSQISSESNQNPHFRIGWYLSNLLPFREKCCNKENRMMKQSERMLDVAEMVKKIKIAMKNLSFLGMIRKFEPRKLNMEQQPAKAEFTEEQLKFELEQSVIDKLKNNPEIPKIYQHHEDMLSICALGENRQLANNYSKQLNDKKLYSTVDRPNFADEEQSKCTTKFRKFASIFQRFFHFFDVFGAKPNLIAPPHNYSVCGCVTTFLVIVLAILTFALTIKNMNLVRTYWDDIYIPPEEHSIKMKTGSTFRAAVCFPEALFKNNLLTGPTRVMEINFYQARRTGENTQFQYYPTESMVTQKAAYFDSMDNAAFSSYNLTYCFRPEKDYDVQVYGDAHSEAQAYIGFVFSPFCSGTPAYCQSIANTTNKKFFALINTYNIVFYIQDVNYYLEEGKLLHVPQRFSFGPDSTKSPYNFTRSTQLTLYLSTTQLIDDWVNWVLGDFATPRQQVLSTDFETIQNRLVSATTKVPYLKFRLAISGRITRIIFSNYKIDFLFAIIGGSFLFYYFVFGCFAKAFNNFKVKSKLAQILYSEKQQCEAGLIQVLRLACCKSPVIRKIQNDLDATNLAKNVDNVYNLSAASYDNVLQRNLALIYMKEGIRSNDGVIIQKGLEEEPQEVGQDISFYSEYYEFKQQSDENESKNNKKNINFEDSVEEQKNQYQNKMKLQSTLQVKPTIRTVQKCGAPINNLDIFHTNSQLTFEGKRSVKSIFGGLFCIGLLVFIILLTVHFLKIYFSNFNRVSEKTMLSQKSDIGNMQFKTGQNFKLLISFTKIDDYDILDVSNITADVGLSVIKYKVERTSATNKTTTKQIINLQKCSSAYLDNFTHSFDGKIFFSRLPYAYCLPDSTVLNLYGSTDDNIRQYFAIKVYNKYAGTTNSTFGNRKVIELFEKAVPRYYISSSIYDYKQGKLRYEMIERSRYGNYYPNYSITVNSTITKNFINYDTAVIPSHQRATTQSYQLKTEAYFFSNVILKDDDRYFEVNFYGEEIVNVYTVKKFKANQIFGIIGGCIAFLFFGLGCLPRSYNQFKMRYKIGTKLYALKSKKKSTQAKSSEKAKLNSAQPELQLQQELSGPELFLAWIFSYWAFITNNYQFCNLMRRYSIIQSRVTSDLNIYHFMKNLYQCETAINNSAPFNAIDINLCRVYPKKVVKTEEQQYESTKRQFKNDVEKHKDLVEACRVNQFTEWDLHNILLARERKLKVDNIFKEKWLDRFFTMYRRSYSLQSDLEERQSNGTSQSRLNSRRKRRSSRKENPKIARQSNGQGQLSSASQIRSHEEL